MELSTNMVVDACKWKTMLLIPRSTEHNKNGGGLTILAC